MKYKLYIKPDCVKFLKTISPKDCEKIVEEIESIADNPRKMGVIKLVGSDPFEYRTRQGNYRIIFTIEDKLLTVHVIRIFHRKEGY